jgi:hypothetical protein
MLQATPRGRIIARQAREGKPVSDKLTIAEWMQPYLPIVGAVVRGLVQIASGFGFTWALTVTGDQVTMAVSAGFMLATLLWSAWQKIVAIRNARRAEVAAAKASAAATMTAGVATPVTLTVTAEGMPNKAVRVSPEEIAAAPSAPANVEPSPAPKGV